MITFLSLRFGRLYSRAYLRTQTAGAVMVTCALVWVYVEAYVIIVALAVCVLRCALECDFLGLDGGGVVALLSVCDREQSFVCGVVGALLRVEFEGVHGVGDSTLLHRLPTMLVRVFWNIWIRRGASGDQKQDDDCFEGDYDDVKSSRCSIIIRQQMLSI